MSSTISTIGVFDGDTLVAYAEVSESGRGDAAVAPAYRRRGIGTALAAWMPVRTGRLGGTTPNETATVYRPDTTKKTESEQRITTKTN